MQSRISLYTAEWLFEIDPEFYFRKVMKKWLIAFILFPQLSFSQSEKAFELYGEGVRAFYANDYETALKKYNEAIALKPTHTGFLYNRGLCFLRMNLLPNAESDFKKILSLDSTYADAYLQLSILRTGEKKYVEALSLAQRAAQISPSNTKVLHQIGLLYYYKRKYQLAIDTYTSLLGYAPDDAQAYYKRGLAYLNTENFAEAVADFSKAFDLEPNNTLALEQRATSYWRANDLEKACRDWHELVRRGVTRAQSSLADYCEK